jgi:hypothetical protein
MARQSREGKRLDAIRSVSLADVVHGRHTRWRRLLRRAKNTLTVVTWLGAAAAAGSVVYFVGSGPGDEAPLVSRTPAPRHAVPLPQSDAAAPEAYLASPPEAAPFEPMNAEAEPAQAMTAQRFETAAVEPRASNMFEAATSNAEPEDLARLPTPRPDEPVVTGSIRVRAAPHASSVPSVEKRRFRPCRALQRLTSRLPFPRVNCGG